MELTTPYTEYFVIIGTSREVKRAGLVKTILDPETFLPLGHLSPDELEGVEDKIDFMFRREYEGVFVRPRAEFDKLLEMECTKIEKHWKSLSGETEAELKRHDDLKAKRYFKLKELRDFADEIQKRRVVLFSGRLCISAMDFKQFDKRPCDFRDWFPHGWGPEMVVEENGVSFQNHRTTVTTLIHKIKEKYQYFIGGQDPPVGCDIRPLYASQIEAVFTSLDAGDDVPTWSLQFIIPEIAADAKKTVTVKTSEEPKRLPAPEPDAASPVGVKRGRKESQLTRWVQEEVKRNPSTTGAILREKLNGKEKPVRDKILEGKKIPSIDALNTRIARAKTRRL